MLFEVKQVLLFLDKSSDSRKLSQVTYLTTQDYIGQCDLHSHYAKVQKYGYGKIGLQFFDVWC